MDVQKAKELLQSANKNFLDIGAYSRAKDVLYLRVSVNNQNLVALEIELCYAIDPKHFFLL